MPAYKDYYSLLGVSRSADKETIASAYKKLAKKYHPDLNPGNKQAEEKFKEINEAYTVLNDPKKRQLYDQLGSNWKQGQQFDGFGGFGGHGFGGGHDTFTFRGGSGASFSDFFESLFGQGGFAGTNFGGGGFDPFQSPRTGRGHDVETEITVPLEDIQCGGRRTLSVYVDHATKTLDVNIPKGMRNGGKLRLAGQGASGPKGSGDLYVTVRWKAHPVFKVKNELDLECEVQVAPWEAVLGCTVQIRTLDGSVVNVVVPAGTSSGRRLRLRDRGLCCGARQGDLYVQVMLSVPKGSTPEELALWRRLAETSSFRPRG